MICKLLLIWDKTTMLRQCNFDNYVIGVLCTIKSVSKDRYRNNPMLITMLLEWYAYWKAYLKFNLGKLSSH